MKAFIPIAIAALIFSSCSTAYQSGQTPDDVYFSPQRPQASQNEYVNVQRNNSRRYQYNDDEYNYDDAYLRMKVRNRHRWAALDNDFYFYNASPFAYSNPYSYNPFAYRYYGDVYYNNFGLYNPYGLYSGFGLGLSYSYNPYFNPYYTNPYYSHYGNYYYNPYGAPVIIVDKNNNRTPVYSRPRTSNLNIYNRSNNTDSRSRRVYVEQSNSRPSYNSNRNNSGSELRNVFGNSDRSSSNTPSRPSVNTPSSSNSSGNSGSSGGSAPVRRF